MMKRLSAEFLGTFWLVLGGIAAAGVLYVVASGLPGFAPIAIGLCLTLIHLISIPVTNTSVNPARSTAVALFAQNGATGQLWFFWIVPIIGGILGALIYRTVVRSNEE